METERITKFLPAEEPELIVKSCERLRNEGDPEKRLEEVEQKYYELIMAVESKYPGESRHETALRYIRGAESKQGQSAKTEG